MGLGSGIRKKPIPDPDPRSKRHRIPDPDPQHCFKPVNPIKAITENWLPIPEIRYRYLVIFEATLGEVLQDLLE